METRQAFLVAAMGTSLTAREGWRAPLVERLEARLSRRVLLLTFARSGANSAWGLSIAAEVAAVRPDVALVEFSANDASLTKGLSLIESTRNLIGIVDTLRAARSDTRIYFMAMSPAIGWRRVVRPWLDSYYDRDERVASELGVGFIDHRPAWKLLSKRELRSAFADGSHPAPEIAARLLPAVIAAAIAGGPCVRR